MDDLFMKSMLADYSAETLKGIHNYIPDKEPKRYLYDLISDYPNRGGKGFRPGLCIAATIAYGGTKEEASHSAVCLELLHNAFLVHDDCEDESYMRRGKPTLHEMTNKSIAINIGDAMQALALQPLLFNKESLGDKVALRIYSEIQHLVIESVEGQAMELGWRQDNVCNLKERDYLQMILKKTCWYTCIHPIRIGAIIGTKGKINPDLFNRLGYFMGTSFQIQDDVLNLVANEDKYGKEICGDIIEGKRTLMLIHLLEHCNARERKKIKEFLSIPIIERKQEDAIDILHVMDKYESIAYAKKVSKNLAGAALKEFYSVFSRLPETKDKTLIESIILYMIHRDY